MLRSRAGLFLGDPSMRHYPIFLDLRGRTVLVSGAGEIATAKLRLLMKTEARIVVFGSSRILSREEAEKRMAEAERTGKDLALVRKQLELSRYYEETRQLASRARRRFSYRTRRR